MVALAKPTRAQFKAWVNIQTRWADNDLYGHVNNVAYYGWFDTAVNAWLIEHGGLNIHDGGVIGLVVHTECDYFEPLAFPQAVDLGLCVTKLGNSSVHYELGAFAHGADQCAAVGRFVHVYVERQQRRPTSLPEPMRTSLQTLLRP
jgi:acyl-CoA thioester hydrolase